MPYCLKAKQKSGCLNSFNSLTPLTPPNLKFLYLTISAA